MSDTLNDTDASSEIPSDEAASETPVTEVSTESSSSEASTETPSGEETLIDGKFRTVADRDHSYKELERRFHEQAGQLSELRRRVETPSGSTPTSDEKPWTKIESERNKWAAYLRTPGLTEEQRAQAFDQVSLHDRKIAYEEAMWNFGQQSRRQTAEQSLLSESRQVLNGYTNDLQNMQSPLYQAAAPVMQALLDAGFPNSDITRALAATYAATKTGKGTREAIQSDRAGLIKALNNGVKKAVVTGAGGPSTVKSGGVTAQDIENMSDKEFREYDRRMQGV